jgi:malonyl-CoA decarboxylase
VALTLRTLCRLTTTEIASLTPVIDEARGAAAVRKLLDRPAWWEVPAISKALRPILTRLAAQYLTATDDRGRAIDRVAHFHLGNGAIVERLNWLGDTSSNGFRQSYAMMVNYRYKLSDVDANHEAYASGKVVASRDVRALAKG